MFNKESTSLGCHLKGKRLGARQHEEHLSPNWEQERKRLHPLHQSTNAGQPGPGEREVADVARSRIPRPRARGKGRARPARRSAAPRPGPRASSSPLAAPERPGLAERPHPGSRHSAPAGYSRRGARSAACPARATARQYEAAPRARRGRETAPRPPPPLATRALKSGPGAAVRAARHPLTSGLPLPPLPRQPGRRARGLAWAAAPPPPRVPPSAVGRSCPRAPGLRRARALARVHARGGRGSVGGAGSRSRGLLLSADTMPSAVARRGRSAMLQDSKACGEKQRWKPTGSRPE